MRKFLIIVSALFFTNSALAVDIPIIVGISEDTYLQLYGNWGTGISFENVSVPTEEIRASWSANAENDYIGFFDDSALAGFELMLTVSDFAYQGSDPDQLDIPASNIKIYAEYLNGQGALPSKGFDDSTKNLNISSESCVSISEGNFSFHPDFNNQTKNFSYNGAPMSQSILSSTANCLAQGALRINHIEAIIPAGTMPGEYIGSITFTIVDG